MGEAKGVFDSLGSSTWTNLQHIVTHRVSLAEAPALYEQFNQQAPGTVMVLLLPDGGNELFNSTRTMLTGTLLGFCS